MSYGLGVRGAESYELQLTTTRVCISSLRSRGVTADGRGHRREKTLDAKAKTAEGLVHELRQKALATTHTR